MFIILSVLIIIPSRLQAKDIGISGQVYEIKERDAIEEIEERAKQVDINKYTNRKEWEEKIKNYQPANLVKLPAAEENRIKLVDMTYTLEFDIPDGKGGILYPRGYTFNPIQYAPWINDIVIINAEREKEIDWFKSSEYSKRQNVLLLLSDGKWFSASEKLKRRVFYLTKPIFDRFKLEHTPSVVTKKNNRIEVREIDIKSSKLKAKNLKMKYAR